MGLVIVAKKCVHASLVCTTIRLFCTIIISDANQSSWSGIDFKLVRSDFTRNANECDKQRSLKWSLFSEAVRVMTIGASPKETIAKTYCDAIRMLVIPTKDRLSPYAVSARGEATPPNNHTTKYNGVNLQTAKCNGSTENVLITSNQSYSTEDL